MQRRTLQRYYFRNLRVPEVEQNITVLGMGSGGGEAIRRPSSLPYAGSNLLRDRRHHRSIERERRAVVFECCILEILKFGDFFRTQEGTHTGRDALVDILEKFQAAFSVLLRGDIAEV